MATCSYVCWRQAALARLDSTHHLHGRLESRAAARTPDDDTATGGGGGSAAASALPGPASIYYHRELLTRSVDGRRVDLLTITSYGGRCEAREEPLEGLFPEGAPRAHEFAGKPVVMVTARVHPGESPASYMFDGLLSLLLQPADPRSIALRKAFVFKLVRRGRGRAYGAGGCGIRPGAARARRYRC